MRRHATVDPVYAGLPNIPPHALPTLRIVGKAAKLLASRDRRQSARPQRRIARRRARRE